MSNIMHCTRGYEEPGTARLSSRFHKDFQTDQPKDYTIDADKIAICI